MSARSGMTGYWAATAGLIVVAVAAPPGWGLAAWCVLGAGATAAVLVGLRRHRPRRAWPWLALAAATLAGAGADVAYGLADPGGQSWLYAVANGAYLVVFCTAATAALRFGRAGSPRADGAALADGLTISVVLALLVWVFVIDRLPAGVLGLARPVVGAYLMGDVLLLSTLVRVVTVRRRSVATLLLMAGGLVGLGADALLAAGVAPVALLGALWLLMGACWGAAALHPSMVRLTEPEQPAAREPGARQLIVVVAAALGAPAILLVQALGGTVRDGVALAVGSAALFLLSLARVAATANTHRRSLAYREHHDTLTGLANRAAFALRLAGAIERGPGPIAVMLIDIDDFKLINDGLGHAAGDEILVVIAHRLGRVLGRSAVPARLGGDEFAVLLPEPADARAADDLAARVAAALAEPFVLYGRDVRLSASVGVAVTGGHDEALGPTRPGQALLSQAALALQAARAEGPGHWCRYREDEHSQLAERMRRRAALARAVHDGAFGLLFQPIVALDGSSTVGFEALVRWSHPTLGPVPPDEFIDLAEETGLIEPIGDWVLRGAIAVAAHWYRSTPATERAAAPYVSVNVSARQFRTPGLAERVAEMLSTAGLPPAYLMVELTESVLLREADDVWGELARLRDTGVRLAIDDFGTGFSTLAYLLQTPIDVIKIDKTFVTTLTTSARHRDVVAGIVHLAHTLGLAVVAEGIETPAHRDLLAAMGCPYGQGFLYAVPLTSDEANRWLAFEAPEPNESEGQTGPGSEYVRSVTTPTGAGTLPS